MSLDGRYKGRKSKNQSAITNEISLFWDFPVSGICFRARTPDHCVSYIKKGRRGCLRFAGVSNKKRRRDADRKKNLIKKKKYGLFRRR